MLVTYVGIFAGHRHYPYEQLLLSWSLYETEWDYWLAIQAGLL